MNKSLFLLLLPLVLFILFFIPKLNKDATPKLSGKPISSDSSSSSLINAFDGNIQTIFKSEKPSNGWIGLQLDGQYKITKIGVAFPEGSKEEEYLLGILEGSNDPTFIDADPIYMIIDKLNENSVNYFEIKTTKKYEYIRYIGPNNKNCIIADLEIYGEGKIDTKLNSIMVNEEDNNYYYQASNLPLVVIHTKDAEEPYDKEHYIDATVTIIKDNKKDTEATAKIRLRGNSTSNLDKKPYRIKFNEKQSPLGMLAKAKNWVLLANHCDKSLIRNKVAYKVSTLFEMKWTPNCMPVDVMLNGEYKGSYDLCDQVEMGKNRVELSEMNKKDTKEPEISGGYFLEADGWAPKIGDIHYNSTKGAVYVVKYPDEDDIIPEQIEYITKFFNAAEEEAYNNIIDKFDIETFCKYILIEDLCGNGETFWSTYMTKERNEDKIRFGPVWDYDLSFDNDVRVYPVLEKKHFLCKFGTTAGTMEDLGLKILSNEKTIEELKKIWNKYKIIVTPDLLLKFIDEENKYIEKSQKLNFMRWDVLNKLILANPVARGSHQAEVDYLKEFIQKRYEILDEIVNIANSSFINEKVEKKVNYTRGGTL
jgi:hypothetical protein